MKRFIVKVQRPLVGSTDMVLVYNRRHSIEAMLPMPSELRRLMGDEYKEFYFAHLEGKTVCLEAVAPWQEW